VTAGLRFDEEMRGFWAPDDAPDAGDTQQYLDAAAAGKLAQRPLVLRLTLSTDDVRALDHDLDRAMQAAGVVAMGGDIGDVAIAGGTVELVKADDAVTPTTRHMRYHLPLPTAGLHLEGFKVLQEGDFTQLWGASTTLYCTLTRGGASGALVGRGVVHIAPSAFAHQVSTMRVTGEDGELRRLELLAQFGAAFFGALWQDYGTVVHRSTSIARHAPPRVHRPLDLPPAEVHAYRTEDGVDLRLTRYRGGDKGPVVLVHGMGANPLTYTLDTVKPNLAEYLVAHGYDVWLQEWRGSTQLPVSTTQFTADDVANFDHPAAEKAIVALTGRRDLHWVTHCVGSMTWMMATLAGTANPASLLLSSVGAHPVAPRLTRLKADLRAPSLLRKLGVRVLTTDSYDDESFGAKAFDALLRFYPIPREERCASAVCRRLSFIYGVAVHHPAVDEQTHATLHELFGVTDLTMMSHLATCARVGHLVAADGKEAYMPNVKRAQLPITLFHGAHNLVWLPESTKQTYDWLVAELGADAFERIVFDNHGHQDNMMGAQSSQAAFPAVVRHLERAGA
jgi:cholesterol oxidase